MTTDGRVQSGYDERDGGGARRFQLNGPAGAAVGLGLAVVMLAPLLLLSKLAGMQFLAVQIAFIGAIYFGFGIADGRVGNLVTEFLVSGAFLFVAAASLWADSPALLAGAYVAHAGWDYLHHRPGISVPVHSWYPPFCVVFDLAAAAFILAWLPLSGVG